MPVTVKRTPEEAEGSKDVEVFTPGHSFTWILEGSETYAVDGKPSRVVKAGDVLHEEPQQVHKLDNDGPVKLLVFRIIEKGKPLTVAVP
jgi:quercetin dioxygenase-like cupin family protein